jgi:replicative DNA helicase
MEELTLAEEESMIEDDDEGRGRTLRHELSIGEFYPQRGTGEITPGVLDIEQELIDHLTNKASLVEIIRDGVSSELLNKPQNKAMLNFAIRYYENAGFAPPAFAMKEEFATAELYEPVADISWVIDKLRERYQRNHIQDLTRNLAALSDKPAEAMELLRNSTQELERKTLSTKTIWTPDDFDLFVDKYKEKILAGQFRGLSIGFDQVDNFTGGLKPGYLAGIAARPKRQKTWYVINALMHQVINGHNPIFFTLENTEDEIWLRLACLATGYPWDLAMRGEIMPKDWDLFREAISNLKQLGNFSIARPNVGERNVPALLAQADKMESDSIIISQFKYLEPLGYYNQAWEKWDSIVKDLKLGATRQGAERPVLVETQLNREAQSMSEMMDADLAFLGLTDMWGQACDIMFCLYQNNDMRQSQITEFGIIEARNSDKSSWHIHSEFKSTTRLSVQ